MTELITLDTRKAEILKALNIFVSLLKANTARAYQKDVEEFMASVKSLTLKEAMAYFQQLQSEGYSASTIDRKKAALSKFFQFLYENGQTSSNPFITETFKLMMKKVRQDADRSEANLSNKPEAHHLKWDEVERMLSLCGSSLEGLRNRSIILLGVYEGLRRSEMVNLKWSDIREEVNGRSLLIRAAKGGTDRVDLHNRVYETLEDLQKAYQNAGIESEHILVSLSNRSHGCQLTEVSLNRIVKMLAKTAGLKKSDEITAHDLRHTCAVQLLLHGASIERVSSHLRHKNIQTTMTYLKTLEIHENSAVAFLP